MQVPSAGWDLVARTVILAVPAAGVPELAAALDGGANLLGASLAHPTCIIPTVTSEIEHSAQSGFVGQANVLAYGSTVLENQERGN